MLCCRNSLATLPMGYVSTRITVVLFSILWLHPDSKTEAHISFAVHQYRAHSCYNYHLTHKAKADNHFIPTSKGKENLSGEVQWQHIQNNNDKTTSLAEQTLYDGHLQAAVESTGHWWCNVPTPPRQTHGLLNYRI